VIDDQVTGEPSSAAAVPDLTAPAVQPPPVTGDREVDDAVARLLDLPAVPLEDHPAVFEAVHRTLTDRLADVEG
jgi:hypothetical protein